MSITGLRHRTFHLSLALLFLNLTVTKRHWCSLKALHKWKITLCRFRMKTCRKLSNQRKTDMKVVFRSRIVILLTILAAGLVMMTVSSNPEDLLAQSRQSNFVGQTPSRPDSSDIRSLRLRFEPGSRSNWHSHAGWQILAAEAGRGRTQIRGGTIQELVPGGPPIHTGPDIVHWHGASPDEHVIQLTFVTGEATWYESVSEQDYLGH